MLRYLSILLIILLTVNSAKSQSSCSPISAGQDQVICYNPNKGIPLHVDSNLIGNDIRWQRTASDSVSTIDGHKWQYHPSLVTYNKGSAKLIVQNFGNGLCRPSSDTMEFLFKKSPLPKMMNDTTVCSFNISLTADISENTSIIWSGGSGSFYPDNKSAKVTFLPAPADTLKKQIVFYFDVTNEIGCSNIDSIIALKKTPPAVNAGGDQAACNRELKLNGRTQNVGATWISLGSGSFSPNNKTLNASYTASMQDSINKKIVLILKGDNVNNCGFSSDTSIVFFTHPNIKIYTPDSISCKDSIRLTTQNTFTENVFWNSSGKGAFYYPYYNGNTYAVSQEDRINGFVWILTTASSIGNCPPVKDSIKIKTFIKPNVNAGPDQNRFNLSSVQLNGTQLNCDSIKWTTTGSGVFFNPIDLQTTYAASSNDTSFGYVKIYLTSNGNNNCPGQISDEATIIFKKLKVYYSIYGNLLPFSDSLSLKDIYLYKEVKGNFELISQNRSIKGYNFNGLDSGTYILQAHPVNIGDKFSATYYDSVRYWQNAKKITITDHDEIIDISMLQISKMDTLVQRKDIILGKVVLDSNKVNSIAYLKGCTVYLFDRWGQCLMSTSLDSANNFSLNGIAKGGYYIIVDLINTSMGTGSLIMDGDPLTIDKVTIYLNTITVTGLSESITEISKPFITYPNPAHDALTLAFANKTDDDMKVEFIDINGKHFSLNPIFNDLSTLTFDISSLMEGFYIIELRSSKGIFRSKFIKVKN